MPLTSDISINVNKFAPSSVSEQTKKVNERLASVTNSGPSWTAEGATEFRRKRDAGETSLPVPKMLPDAKEGLVPSRDAGRDIPIRIYNEGKPVKGLIMHIHGGGFVLTNHKQSDARLKVYANNGQLVAISVGYRLAPEDPFPAALNDCYDVATYLVDHAETEFGAKLMFVAGESAGGHLAAMTTFELMRVRPAHPLAGVILQYGEFDLSLSMPVASTFRKPLVLTIDTLRRFTDAFCPGMSLEDRRSPTASPLYVDMKELAAASSRKTLPPALFICGTEDIFLDETLLMSFKWSIAPGESIVKFFPGAAHGFTLFPGYDEAQEASSNIQTFITDRLKPVEASTS